jgi:hypothetical protein
MSVVGTEHALATIAAFGGMGWLLDKWIGKTRQARMKDKLETWWLKLSYVRLGNFGQEEALFAVRAMDFLFGKRVLSIKRALVVLTLLMGFMLWAIILPIIEATADLWQSGSAFKGLLISEEIIKRIFLVDCTVSAVVLAISLSLTRLASLRVAAWLIYAPWANFLGLAVLAVLQYLILRVSAPLVGAIHAITILSTSSMINNVGNPKSMWSDYVLGWIFSFDSIWPAPPPSMAMTLNKTDGTSDVINFGRMDALSYIPSLIRLSILSVFATSYFLAPLKGFVLKFYAIIIESDTPLFTLIFGGTAAIAKIAEQIISW